MFAFIARDESQFMDALMIAACDVIKLTRCFITRTRVAIQMRSFSMA